MKNLVKSKEDVGLLIARIFLSVVIFPHGAQKLLGMFGGFGFEGTMQYFTQTVHLPWIIGFLVIMIEFFGPLFLIAGLATRYWSTAIAVVMVGVIVTTFHTFFFMNWFAATREEGYEFFVLATGLSLSLLSSGSGKYSIDEWIKSRRLATS